MGPETEKREQEKSFTVIIENGLPRQEEKSETIPVLVKTSRDGNSYETTVTIDGETETGSAQIAKDVVPGDAVDNALFKISQTRQHDWFIKENE